MATTASPGNPARLPFPGFEITPSQRRGRFTFQTTLPRLRGMPTLDAHLYSRHDVSHSRQDEYVLEGGQHGSDTDTGFIA